MSQRGVLSNMDGESLTSAVPVAPAPVEEFRTLPYEVPQLPIEVIEKKLLIQKQLSRVDRIEEHPEIDDEPLEFQRIRVTGEETSGVPLEDLRQASEHLVEALKMRQRYMKCIGQSFHEIPDRFLSQFDGSNGHKVQENHVNDSCVKHMRKAPSKRDSFDDITPIIRKRASVKRRDGEIVGGSLVIDPWAYFIPEAKNYTIRPVEGVFQVFDEDNVARPYAFPDLADFVSNVNRLSSMISDGPLKSFCYRRLAYLSSKFQLHVLLNDLRELAEQKTVPHRDFYNIRKVDTHIHAASCMNHKHLLRFMKKTLKTCADEVVTANQETLKQDRHAMENIDSGRR